MKTYLRILTLLAVLLLAPLAALHAAACAEAQYRPDPGG